MITTFDIFDHLNKGLIPGKSEIITDPEELKKITYLSKFKDIRTRLIEFKPTNEEEKLIKHTYLFFLNYYLFDYELARRNLKVIENIGIKSELNNFFLTLKFKLKKSDQIVVMVSEDYSESKGFEIMEKSLRNKISIWPIYRFDKDKFIETVRYKEQIFILAHGDEDGLELGDKKITPDCLIEVLDTIGSRKLDVLGLMSCGNAFNRKEIRDRAYYYVTDNESSFTNFTELFMYGYLRNYTKTWDIIGSFDMGLNVPILSAKSRPHIELWELGVRIRP